VFFRARKTAQPLSRRCDHAGNSSIAANAECSNFTFTAAQTQSVTVADLPRRNPRGCGSTALQLPPII
jgi:hypothetical protein